MSVLDRLEALLAQGDVSALPWWYDGRDVFHKPPSTNLDQIIGQPWTLHLYVCLVPLLPLHITVTRWIRSEGEPQP